MVWEVIWQQVRLFTWVVIGLLSVVNSQDKRTCLMVVGSYEKEIQDPFFMEPS